MQQQQMIDRIEAYLTGSLSAAERAAFESDLKTDTALKGLFDQHAKAHAVINHAYNRQLKQRLIEIEGETGTPTARVRPMFRRVAVAASIVLLAGVGAWLWSGSAYSNDAMAEQLFFRDSYDVMRSSDQTKTLSIDSLLNVAQRAFEAGDYGTAQTIYEPLLTQDTEYLDQIEWNLAMCLLMQDDRPAADKLLDKIASQPDHGFHSNAKKLQRKMNHLFYRWRN